MRLALASLAALLLPAAALAQGAGYSVTLETAAPQRMMVKDVRWTCVGTECTAARSGTSADINICRAVAKKLGPVRGFSAGDRRFDQAEVTRCNGE